MATKSEPKYDVRAPPRRRQKGAELDEQPVFLRKAYAMISSCPVEIGGWSESGDTVVIKDAKAFAERIIPTAYKHSNFSSFVRQLNFFRPISYPLLTDHRLLKLDGFRKVKSNVLSSKDWWEFRHPHFVRGKPQLLSEIKRSLHFEQGGAEVSELKREVQDLNDKVHHLHHIIEDLSQKVSDMSLDPSGSSGTSSAGASVGARRRVRARPLSLLKEEDEEEALGEGFSLLEEEEDEDGGDEEATAVPPEARREVPSFSEEEVQALQELWDEHEPMDLAAGMDTADALLAQPQTPLLPPEVAVAPVPSSGLQELPQILALLSPEMQLRFVDKLAESVSLRLMDSKGSQMPEIALPLASAALGAFLMSSLSMGANNHLTNQKVATVSA
eukprot:gene35079-42484_t